MGFFFLHTCSPFKTSRNASSGPPSLGGSFLGDVSQPLPLRIWSLFSCAFSDSCYRLVNICHPVCAGVQFWQHGWDCFIQIAPSQVYISCELGLKIMWRLTFPLSFRSAITTRLGTSIRISEEHWDAGPTTGDLDYIVMRSVAHPCFRALWFLADELGAVSKPRVYPRHHIFFHVRLKRSKCWKHRLHCSGLGNKMHKQLNRNWLSCFSSASSQVTEMRIVALAIVRRCLRHKCLLSPSCLLQAVTSLLRAGGEVTGPSMSVCCHAFIKVLRLLVLFWFLMIFFNCLL